MDDAVKKDMTHEEQAAEATPDEKEKKGSFIKKIFHKKEKPVKNEEASEKKPKKGFLQWCKEHKKEIALGAAALGTGIGFCVKMFLQNKPGSIDPDAEMEPGDYDPREDMDETESTEETSEEEVNAE